MNKDEIEVVRNAIDAINVAREKIVELEEKVKEKEDTIQNLQTTIKVQSFAIYQKDVIISIHRRREHNLPIPRIAIIVEDDE